MPSKISLTFLILMLFQFCKPSSNAGKPQDVQISDSVKVKISWNYRDFPLKMQIYEPAVRQLNLWEKGSKPNLEKLPVSSLIESSSFNMFPGSKKVFVLVAHNPTQETFYFFAAPHSVNPPEFSLGFKFKCLYVNHAFTVPAGEYWYRVVELRMSKNFRGNEIDISHDLIGLTYERMKDFDNQKLPSINEDD